jgi:membrane dipeptidase
MKIFDAHADTLAEVLDQNKPLDSNDLHVSLEKMRAYDGFVQVFAAWIDEKYPSGFRRANDIIDAYYAQAPQNGVVTVLDADGLREAQAPAARLGVLLAIEDARALEGRLENLSYFYARGVRSICLAWNYSNEACDGVMVEKPKGLSAFGKALVAKMHETGVVADVSHLAEPGFWDVAEISAARGKPFIASHSNAKAVCGHARNLTDGQLKAVFQSGGVVGINLLPLFLNGTMRASSKDILRHIDHILALGGENHIGFGCDFDGITEVPDGFSDAAGYEAFLNEMAKTGYSNEVVEKISHRNFMNVYEKVLKK